MTAQLIWIADASGDNKLEFTGLSAGQPGYPKPKFARQGSSATMIPGLSENNTPIPGRTIHQDFGRHVSSGKIEITIPYANESLYATLDGINATIAPVRIGLNGGTEVWLCAWDEGVSFDPEPIGGSPDTALGPAWKITLKFKILSRVV